MVAAIQAKNDDELLETLAMTQSEIDAGDNEGSDYAALCLIRRMLVDELNTRGVDITHPALKVRYRSKDGGFEYVGHDDAGFGDEIARARARRS
jgi:hypothetical protein